MTKALAAGFAAAVLSIAGCSNDQAQSPTQETSAPMETQEPEATAPTDPVDVPPTEEVITPTEPPPTGPEDDHAGHETPDHGGHEGHDHPADGGPPPAGIEVAPSPKYPVGTKVTLKADHMPGMDGAPGQVVGAFKTHVYSIDFTPVGDAGEPVLDHKWVVQEEIKDAGDKLLAKGTQVTVEADHMTGMKGATATIASSTDETVYMVDVEMDGMTMKNHKWVVESEISPSQ